MNQSVLSSTQHFSHHITSAILALMVTLSVSGMTRVQATEMQILDEAFYETFSEALRAEKILDGFTWLDGPLWIEDGGYLLFSDIGKNQVFRWSPDQEAKVYLQPSGDDQAQVVPWLGSNGLTLNAQGHLILAQHGKRAIARMKTDLNHPSPKYEYLASHVGGRRLNSPNDVAYDNQGNLFFTDPPYGLNGFENSPERELDVFGIYRIDATGKLDLMFDGFNKPNGLAFSQDYKTLYISDSDNDKSALYAFNIDEGTPLSDPQKLFELGKSGLEDVGFIDGIKVHKSGVIFTALKGGLGLLTPKGKLIGFLPLGQTTNIGFDQNFDTAFVTTPNSVYRLKLE